jgi:hypothetical protein
VTCSAVKEISLLFLSVMTEKLESNIKFSLDNLQFVVNHLEKFRVGVLP